MNISIRALLVILLLLSFSYGNAQLGFCTGNAGDPIFTEDFGSGTTNGPPLPAGVTTYTYVTSAPEDGQYTVSNQMGQLGSWHSTGDRTPGDTNGKAFIVNASFTADQFYARSISGLCENTSYEFSAWLLNVYNPTSGVCGSSEIPINVQFQIWDETDTILLASGSTGNIFGTTSPEWDQYALTFQTLASQTSVILKMLNNGDGGCGNDLAIDDITFRSCGDATVIEDTANQTGIMVCEDATPTSVTLTATPDFSVYTTHAYQWQESADGVNWTDIPGATNATYTTPNISTTTYYRVKVAEDVINLSTPLCSTISDNYIIEVIPQPLAPVSGGDILNCSDLPPAPMIVNVPTGVSVNWYDDPVAGSLLLADSNSFLPNVANTYYAEAVSNRGGCVSAARTAVSIRFEDAPVVNDEIVDFCEDTTVTLDAGIDNVSYDWSTGALSRTIDVADGGTYTVEVTTPEGCSSIKTITVNERPIPVIASVEVSNTEVIIETANQGAFEYSLDGDFYQPSNTFSFVRPGIQTAYVRDVFGCGVTTMRFLNLQVPKFMTPNSDGVNDDFAIEGLEFFRSPVEIRIFDRFGKLLKTGYAPDFSWDGNYNNTPLPADDYWYELAVDEIVRRGHFTLKR